MTKIEPVTAPAALRKPYAAAHVGISPTHFDKMVDSGDMPQPRQLHGVKVWLRVELEEALQIAPTDDQIDGENPCDRLLEA